MRPGKTTLSLQQHLIDTEFCSMRIFDPKKRFGRNWCRFFRITGNLEVEKFVLNLRVAALFHDIGKANEDFQNAVGNNEGTFRPQSIRHEHLSALLLHLSEVREWLVENELIDHCVITSAVLSHHLKASADVDQWKWMQPKERTSIGLFLSHEQISSVFDRIRSVAELSNSMRLDHRMWSDIAPWNEALMSGLERARQFRRTARRDNRRLQLSLAVKAALIASDAVASGLVREDEVISDWIDEKAHSPSIKNGEISDAIVDKRGKEIFGDRPIRWNDFQINASQLGSRALMLAACGAGKTIAAWKWAEAQTCSGEFSKVIFLYPTRGTATEGFKDYVGHAPESEAGLLHGSSKYELQGIAENPSEATRDKNYETNARLFALGFWGKKYFSATVDQFLSFMEHNYSSICLLPALADGVVIVDEVHSFDRRMFETLVCFLKQFDVPVLCMTATLPNSRKQMLSEIGLRVFPSDEEYKLLDDLRRAESHPRYDLELVGNESEAMRVAKLEFEKGKRVLWVVNTVNRCQRISRRIEKEVGIPPLVYHSRYRLIDRKRRHEETIAAFKQIKEPCLAVTTQVCEMSLDLDADVLITEVAPITSLVQRFGRSNRHLARGDEFRSRLVTYMPESGAPYDMKEDLEPALEFLKDLPPKNISQKDLAEKLEEHAQRVPLLLTDFAPFLSSGYFAVPGAGFRESNDFARPSILWSEKSEFNDLVKVQQLLSKKEPIDAFIVNVPKRFVLGEFEKPPGFPKYLSVAPADRYDRLYGFQTEIQDD
ncbi:MAG: CRISPR-associated helicase Cas3' [Pyrinomonadaceae bacterium]